MFFLFYVKAIDKTKKVRGIEMAIGNKKTEKEKLIEFVHKLTDEEIMIIISHLKEQEQEQP